MTADQYLPRLRETAADIERMLTTWPEDKRDGNYQAHADDAVAYRWAADEIERLRRLLSDAEDPVSCQLAEARRNLELYKGYSSRERRYQIEIEGLERLQKTISAIPKQAKWDCACNQSACPYCGPRLQSTRTP